MNTVIAESIAERIYGMWTGNITREGTQALIKVLISVDEEPANRAIDALAKTEQYRPSPARLLQAIKSIERGSEAANYRHECGTCDGTWWVPDEPVEHLGNRVSTVRRCPDCFDRGTPTPVRYHRSNPGRIRQILVEMGRKPALEPEGVF